MITKSKSKSKSKAKPTKPAKKKSAPVKTVVKKPVQAKAKSKPVVKKAAPIKSVTTPVVSATRAALSTLPRLEVRPVARPTAKPARAGARPGAKSSAKRGAPSSRPPERSRARVARSSVQKYAYMKAPGIEHAFEVGDHVEVFCDHEKNSERIRGWVKGIVVQVDHKMVAVQFRSNVYLTDGWMVPDRILWYPLMSEHIRPFGVKKIVKEMAIPDY